MPHIYGTLIMDRQARDKAIKANEDLGSKGHKEVKNHVEELTRVYMDFLWEQEEASLTALVAKRSATRHSVAAPPPGARQGFGGPVHLRHPSQASGMECDRALLGGCSCDTPATPWKQQNEPRQGCSYTLERDRGGCSVCAT